MRKNPDGRSGTNRRSRGGNRPGWVARHLAHASAAWVSQDSVSMVYEALGSGAPVGILSVPRRHGSRKSRILSGLETLEKEGMVTGYSDWKNRTSA